LASLLAGRHSAVDAASVGRRQLHAFTDDIRSRFQGAGRRKIITIAAGLRTHSAYDAETTPAPLGRSTHPSP
jgi:hypothetical protein